jgi:hypothetical protein
VTPPIGQTLTSSALNREGAPFGIVHAQGNAVRISEIELAQIAVQVLLGAMLIDALHASLEDRIVAFNRVGGDIAANVLIGAVGDGLVAFELAADFLIDVGFRRS